MVLNMAAVGCSIMDRKDMGEKNATKLALSCKRNGFNLGCYCEDKMETRNNCRSQGVGKLIRINGASKTNNNNCFPRPSVPTPRSRRDRHPSEPEASKRRRRSSRHDPGDSKSGKPPDGGDLPGTPVSPSPAGGPDTPVSPSPAGGPDTPESLEVASINQNFIKSSSQNCGKTITQNCIKNNHKIFNSVPHVKDIDILPLVSQTNGVLFPSVTPDSSRSCTPISLSGSTLGSSGIAGSPFGSLNCKLDSTPVKDTQLPVKCQWNDCDVTVQNGEIMEHIRSLHVQPQKKNETFVCLWDGCKVYNMKSSSKSWLDRHILTHSGDKPFRCIVDRCGARFTSQGGLERHVNSHFNAQEQSPNQKHLKHGREDTPTKLFKRKRLIKQKRGIQAVKTDDYIDQGVMEKLETQLNSIAERTQLDLNGSLSSLTFHSTVIARKTEDSGKVKFLLHWMPADILPDEWVSEAQVQYLQTRSIPITCLPRDCVTNLHPSLYHQHRYRKHRRK